MFALGVGLLLAGCGPSAADVSGTAQALGATMIAETQTAQPTETPLPSATATAEPTKTPTPAATHTATLTATETPALATESPTAWINPSRSSRLRFENNTGEEIFIVLDGPVYAEYTFTASWNLETQWGSYRYLVWTGGLGPRVGNFTVTNPDKHTLVINDDKIIFLIP